MNRAKSSEKEQSNRHHDQFGIPYFLNLVLLVGLTVIGTYLLRYARRLPLEIYEQRILMIAAARSPWFWAMFSIATSVFCCSRHLLWQMIDCWRSIRWVLVPSIAMFVWSYSLYDFNYYLERWHFLDRSVLVLLGGLSVWRPRFLGFFVLQLGILLGQFSHPLVFSWTDKSVPIDILVLIQFFLVGRSLRLFRDSQLLVAILLVLAAHFFRPGIGKVLLNWNYYNDLSNLVMSAIHQNAWLAWLSDEQKFQVLEFTAFIKMPLQFATVLLEISAVIYLWNRRLLICLILANIGLHLGIFVASGILFWKWMIVEAGIVVAIASLPREVASRTFGRRQAFFFAVLVIGSYFYYPTAPVLAWYDASLAVHYRIEVIGEFDSYQIPPRNLAPFDLHFAQGRLGFLDSKPMLVDCLGSCTSVKVFQECSLIDSSDDLVRIRAELGKSSNCEIRIEDFKKLIGNYLRQDSPCAESNLSTLFPFPRPPQHIWTFSQPDPDLLVWKGQEPAEEVLIRRITVAHVSHEQMVLESEIVFAFNP